MMFTETMMRRRYVALIAALGALPVTAMAQQGPAPADAAQAEDAGEGEDIVVTGQRPPGSVPGDIPPEKQLSPADIRSYGVGTVAELLSELAPQTTSGRGGQPVVLLGGRRISGFAEIRDIPTEAILRVDILPEEVALKFGYRADQKVVNIVLRRRFRAVTLEATGRIATEGGRNSPQLESDLLQIRGAGRVNLHAEYQSSSALTESERDIPAVPNTSLEGTGQRAFRTLLPSTETFTANAVYARNIFGNVAATVNGSIEATDSNGLFGLPGVSFDVPGNSPFATGGTAAIVTRTLGAPGYAPLAQSSSSLTSHLGTTLNGDAGTWRWSLTGAYDRVDSKTFTDTGLDARGFQSRLDALDPPADPRGPLGAGDLGALPANRSYSTSGTGGVDALFSGTLFSLPAGAIATSVRVGGSTSDFDSRSVRGDLVTPGNVSRDIVNGQVNIDLPIASRSKQVLGALGNLSANLNLGVDRLSDFGTLATLGYGLNWSPIVAVRLIASATDQQEAPSASQIGGPPVFTPDLRVFDFVNGTNATVTRISGGNPLLGQDTRHVRSLGLTLKPWSAEDVTFTANYVSTRIDDPIAGFPGATAAIASVFPQRFIRDANGQLLQIDSRPINFAESDRSQLRWGLNVSVPLKSRIQKEIEAYRAGAGPNPFAGLFPDRRPGGEGGGGRAPGGEGRVRGDGGGRGPGGGGGPGGFGGGRGGGQGGGGQGGGGRLNFAVYHTWHFTDTVTVADGGPKLDLLNGDTLGGGGGQARHEVEVQAGYSNNGLGARLSGNWMSATDVDGGTPASPETLKFASLATLNLRLFADLGGRLDLVKKHPWLRGLRVSLSVDNIANTRQRVTDGAGVTPVAYAPDYIDPLGRTIRLSVRKLFF